MDVSMGKVCLFYIFLVCNFEKGILESTCNKKQNKELLSRLSSKLTYIAAEIQETYSLLKNMSRSGLQRDCLALLKTGRTQSGVYNISVTGTDTTSVWCDMETDGGGWTVFQRRIDGATGFFREWDEYRDGFGDVHHEFWLGVYLTASNVSQWIYLKDVQTCTDTKNTGNANLHALTSSCDTELRVDLEDFENNTAYAQYQTFAIGNAASEYRLNISGYSGNAGDSLSYHNGQSFSTKDDDNDNYHGNCADIHRGAWWYDACYRSNLNGLYFSSSVLSYSGIKWAHFGGYYTLKSGKMMFRRLDKT